MIVAPFPLVTTTVELVTRAEANQHTHWRARQERAKEANEVVFDALSLAADPIDPRPGLVVRLTRIVGREREQLDDDNTTGALKHVRDAVARWLGVDDRDPCVSWTTTELFTRGPLRARVEVFRRGRPAPGVILADDQTVYAVRAAWGIARKLLVPAEVQQLETSLIRAGLLEMG